MTIELDWGDFEQKLLVMRFCEQWTGDEFVYCIAQLQEIGFTAIKGIELMIDLRKSLKPPNNLLTLLSSIINRPLPKNFKQVVIISNFGFWNRMYAIVNSLYKNKFTTPIIFVDSVDKGYDALDAFKDVE